MFKCKSGSAIDLILINNSWLYQKRKIFQAGISDHHYLISKIIYDRKALQTFIYRIYKNFREEQLKKVIRSDYSYIAIGNLTSLWNIIRKRLDQFAPAKKIALHPNEKPTWHPTR